MNTQSPLPSRFAARRAAAGAAFLIALFGTIAAIADQPASTTAVSSLTDVSLSDLNLSSPEGMRLARVRLQTMAEHLCANHGGGREPSSQPAFGACVDSTVANALRHIDALTQTHRTVRNTVTLGASVSLADLDLSTLEGARIARQRLETMSRRLCDELARREDLSYQASYAACLRDTFRGAQTQADAIAAARNARTAQRSAP
jgi:UrcA family protein